MRRILDEVHTDQGGSFAELLSGFRNYGDEVAAEIKELLRKADEAEASGARISIEGSSNLGWTVADGPKETVKVTEQAGQNAATKAAGGRA